MAASSFGEDKAGRNPQLIDVDFDDKNLGGGDGGLDEEDGEDPVVREVPVYLSGQLAQELHVIQYPNRPFYRPYDLPATARMKSQNKLLELEYALPPESPHLDDQAPRHLRLDRIKVQSSYLDPMTTYGLGIMQDGALHLTPLAGIFQMRASCDHVDAAPAEGEEDGMEGGAEAAGAAAAEGGGVMDEGGGEESESDAAKAAGGGPVKLQHVEFKKKESEKAAAARRTSYAFKKQQEEGEAWTELGVHSFESEASQLDYEKMFCSEAEQVGRRIKFRGGGAVYTDMYRSEKAKASSRDRGDDLSRMIMNDHHHHQQRSAALLREEIDGGGSVEEKATVVAQVEGSAAAAAAAAAAAPGGGGKRPAVMSIQHLRGGEQVAVIMERAHIVSLEQVLELNGNNVSSSSSSSYSSSSISISTNSSSSSSHARYHLNGPTLHAQTLEHLKKHAVLVRGNWVRKSSFYGLPPRLTHARDILLLLLEGYGGVNRLQFCKAARVSDEESQQLLRPVACLNKETRMWMAACPDDRAFLTVFSEVALQQQKQWREKEREKEMQAILTALGGEPDCPFPGPVMVGNVGAGGGGGGGGGRGGGGGCARAAGGCEAEAVAMEVGEAATGKCSGTAGGGGGGRGRRRK